MLLLAFFHLLQDITHVELHTSNKGYLKDKSTHKVIEHFTAFPLKIDRLILFKVVKNLVMSHCKFHHAINLALQFFLVCLL